MSTYLITSAGIPIERIEAVDLREAETIARRRHGQSVQVHTGPATVALTGQPVQLTEAREAELIRGAQRRVAELDRDLDAELQEAFADLGLADIGAPSAFHEALALPTDDEKSGGTRPTSEVAKIEDEMAALRALYFQQHAITREEYARRRDALELRLGAASPKPPPPTPRPAKALLTASARLREAERDLDAELREALGELGLGESSVIRGRDGEVIAATGPATKQDEADVAKLEAELDRLGARYLKGEIAKDEYDQRRAELKTALVTANAKAAGDVAAVSHESARPRNLDEQLVEAFRSMGHSDATARAMAAGR